jgi:hypothetical protein
METWMWISLWVLQTLVGTVLWRKYPHDKGESIHEILILNAIIIVNIFVVVYLLFESIGYLYKQLCYLIDYLAGVKNENK